MGFQAAVDVRIQLQGSAHRVVQVPSAGPRALAPSTSTLMTALPLGVASLICPVNISVGLCGPALCWQLGCGDIVADVEELVAAAGL